MEYVDRIRDDNERFWNLILLLEKDDCGNIEILRKNNRVDWRGLGLFLADYKFSIQSKKEKAKVQDNAIIDFEIVKAVKDKKFDFTPNERSSENDSASSQQLQHPQQRSFQDQFIRGFPRGYLQTPW